MKARCQSFTHLRRNGVTMTRAGYSVFEDSSAATGSGRMFVCLLAGCGDLVSRICRRRHLDINKSCEVS